MRQGRETDPTGKGEAVPSTQEAIGGVGAPVLGTQRLGHASRQGRVIVLSMLLAYGLFQISYFQKDLRGLPGKAQCNQRHRE